MTKPPGYPGWTADDVPSKLVEREYRNPVPAEDQAAHDAALPSLEELEHIDVDFSVRPLPRAVRPPENPKAQAATRNQKAPLDLLEPAADELIARALATGAEKYGKMNYKTIPIYLSVYLAAIKRHVNALLAGEDLDPDSDLPHLAHIGANVHVVLAVLNHDNLVDDRGPAQRSETQEDLSNRSNEPQWN